MTKREQSFAARCATGALLALAASSGLAADGQRLDCPAFPLPDAKLTWVAPSIAFNGLPMQIRQFDSGESPKAVLDYYRREWRGTRDRPGFVEYPLDGWQVIAALRERCFYTVQVKASGRDGSTGLLGMSRLTDPSQVREVGHNFPMMSGSNVINDIDHFDPGKRGRTLLFVNEFSTDANAGFYRRVLMSDGWNIVQDHALPLTGNRTAYVMTLRRGAAETSMSITRNGESTTVLVNLVDRN
jgi:hypothetical protein